MPHTSTACRSVSLILFLNCMAACVIPLCALPSCQRRREGDNRRDKRRRGGRQEREVERGEKGEERRRGMGRQEKKKGKEGKEDT